MWPYILILVIALGLSVSKCTKPIIDKSLEEVRQSKQQ